MIKISTDNSLVTFTCQNINWDIPDFAKFETDTNEINRIVKKYNPYNNIIIIGNGGAINSFRGFYSSLGFSSKKRVTILNTIEPDHISQIRMTHSIEDTVVVTISKSGTNPTAIELLFAFWDYPKLIVCTEGSGTLYQIVKRKKLDYLSYPSDRKYLNLDDRHTGISASGLVPLALLGIDITKVYHGAKVMYKQCEPTNPDNPALKLASCLYQLEEKGYTEVFTPIYSTRLFGFLPLIIQFMHETVCKDGKGQTFFGDLGPETQHHTNQRLFGGRTDIMALFISALQDDCKSMIEIPDDLTDIDIRSGLLHDFDNIPLTTLFDFEFQGTIKSAQDKKIPFIHIDVGTISEESIGEFLALLQYTAFYSAHLRGVNPFGQPEVEQSKDISFDLIKSLRN